MMCVVPSTISVAVNELSDPLSIQLSTSTTTTTAETQVPVATAALQPAAAPTISMLEFHYCCAKCEYFLLDLTTQSSNISLDIFTRQGVWYRNREDLAHKARRVASKQRRPCPQALMQTLMKCEAMWITAECVMCKVRETQEKTLPTSAHANTDEVRGDVDHSRMCDVQGARKTTQLLPATAKKHR